MKKPTRAQLKAAKAAVDLEEVIDAERKRREVEREERAALNRQVQREALKAKARATAQEAGEAVRDGAKSFVFQLAGLAIVVMVTILVILTPIPRLTVELISLAIAFLNTTLPFLSAQALCLTSHLPKPYASDCVPVSWSAVVLFVSLGLAGNLAIDYAPKVIARIKRNRRKN